jgi:hypothetical protein
VIFTVADEREREGEWGGWFFRRKERVKLTFMWGDKIEASGAVFNYKGTPSFYSIKLQVHPWNAQGQPTTKNKMLVLTLRC